MTVDGTETRTYNGFGQLEGIAGIGNPASFAYRPDGLRYSKTTGSGSTAATHIHLWDGQNIVAEVGATGALNTRYIRGTGLVAREVDGALQYYLFDAHGDVLHRLDASGNLLRTYRYDAFGNEIDPEPLDTNPFRYCGEYFDREIGTYYLRARNYDPRTGRFTTEDALRSATVSLPGDRKAVDPLSLNLYTYCHNNPVAFVDPRGSSEGLIKSIKENVKSASTSLYNSLQTFRKQTATLRGTYSEGVDLNISLFGFLSGSLSYATVYDVHGNVEEQLSFTTPFSFGTGVPDMTRPLSEIVNNASFKAWGSASIMMTRSITSAPSVDRLLQPTTVTGGSAGWEYLMVGAEYLKIHDTERGETYYGGTLEAGGGVGAEIHHGPSNTITLSKHNLYDRIDQIYQSIMEW